MKKIFLTGMVLVLSAASLSAFTAQRRQWWEQHLEGLASQRGEQEKNHTRDNHIITLIDRETARGKKMLGLLTRADKGASPAQTETSTASPERTAAIVSRTLKPLIAAHLLKQLTGEIISRSRPESVKKTVRNEAAALLRADGNFTDDTLLQEIITADISRSEWDNLYAESFMTDLMVKKKELASAFSKSITEAAVKKFSPSGNSAGEREIAAFTAEKFSSEAPGFGGHPMNGSQVLRETWSWADISSRIKNDCRHYREIIDMLHKTERNIPYPKLRYYLRNVPSLDIVYFNGISKLALTDIAGESPSGGRSIDTVIGKIDLLRRKIGPSLTGKESEEYFNSLRSRFDSIIARHAPGPGPSPSAEDYRDRSLTFLRWVSATQKRDSRELTVIYRTKISRTMEYADFIGTLFREASEIPPSADKQVHLYFKAALQHSPRFFSFVESGLAIPTYYNKNLPPSDTHALRAQLRKYFKYRATVQRDIRESSNEYRQNVLRKKNVKKKRRGQRNERIARYDVEIMATTLNDYVTAFKSLRYGEKALTLYARTSIKLGKDIERGMTPVLRKCMERNSLFPAVPAFDAEKVTAEYSARKYLRSEIRSLISRITHLEGFYDRYNINVHNILERSEAQSIEALISKKTEVIAGSWTLNEENFFEIDKKMALALFNTRKKSIWNGSSDRVHTVHLPGTGIALNIPDGWSRNDASSKKSPDMHIMTFTSVGDTASIDIATLPAGGNTMGTINSEWLKTQRAAVVKTKWGRKNNIDYFWSLAKNGSTSIRESYIFQKGSDAVIISGSTTRTRYNFFKKKIDRVFESVHTPQGGN